MEEQITFKIPNVSFASVIEGRTTKFLKFHFETDYLIKEANYLVNGQPIRERLNLGLAENQTKDSKIIFLTQVLTHFVNLLPKFQDRTILTSENRLDYIQNTIPYIEEIIFEITQSIEFLGIIMSPNTFTPEEYINIGALLQQVLDELNIIKAGNSIQGEMIEELQNDVSEIKANMVLGKKPFYQRIIGIVASYSGNKIVDEGWDRVVKPIFNEILKDFIKNNRLESVIKLIE